jgi:predicted O-methyltransferase YrrM
MFAFDEKNKGPHYEVILSIIKTTTCQKYLELGLYHGDLISKVSNIVKKADGVDLIDNRKYFNFNFIQKSTDDFFKENNETYDIIFIDADHCFESVKKDFENSLKILSKHGIILIHDTDPMFKYLLAPGYCNDSFKMCNYIKENHPELNFINLPISEAGLMIVNKSAEYRHLHH